MPKKMGPVSLHQETPLMHWGVDDAGLHVVMTKEVWTALQEVAVAQQGHAIDPKFSHVKISLEKISGKFAAADSPSPLNPPCPPTKGNPKGKGKGKGK